MTSSSTSARLAVSTVVRVNARASARQPESVGPWTLRAALPRLQSRAAQERGMGRSMEPINAGCLSLSPVVVAEQTLLYVAVVGGVCARLSGASMTLEVAALAATAALSGALAVACSPLCVAKNKLR